MKLQPFLRDYRQLINRQETLVKLSGAHTKKKWKYEEDWLKKKVGEGDGNEMTKIYYKNERNSQAIKTIKKKGQRRTCSQ